MRVAERMRRGLAVVAGALLMLWPALLNGYPLLYPDSMSYLGDGHPLARILFLHGAKDYGAMRSEIYSLGIFLFHWNISAWPVVGLQALLTSYVLWLVVRSFSSKADAEAGRGADTRRTEAQFLVLVGLVSLTASLAWYVCVILPDILGPVLYLAIYLLVFARETLSAREKWSVAAIGAWAMASHSTHLLLAACVCALLVLLSMVRWPPMRGRVRAIGAVAALILFVAGAQIALHEYLYGKPTLTGNRMPYTMARVIADGPGRWYLQEHCGQLQWAICRRVDNLPTTDDDFLWADGGVWVSATPEMQKQLRQEEMPLVIAAVREYPRAQVQRSLANFWEEFTDFGLWDFCPNGWVDSELDKVLPGAEAKYVRTREAQSLLPNVFFTTVQQWVVMGSALAIVVCVPVLWVRKRWRVLGLVATAVPVVVVNAFVTAVLSEPDSRYQARVIWLIPLVAGLIVMDYVNCMRARSGAVD